MDNDTTQKFHFSQPLEEGVKTFVQIEEDGCYLIFDPHLRIDWHVYKEGEELNAYVNYDFGMKFKINLTAQRKSWWNYGCLNKKSTNEEIISAIVRFDLFHAFTHYEGDPNYSHLHWALWGCLRDQVKVIETELD